MFQSSFDLLNVFVQPPGNFLYFLTVMALSLISLGLALSQRDERVALPRRYASALGGVVVAWVMLLAGALFVMLPQQSAAQVIPPLERAAIAVSIVLLGWAFITVDNDRWQRAGTLTLLVLLALIVAGYILTGVQWVDQARRMDFNLTTYATGWAMVSAVLAGLGLLLTGLSLRQVVDAPLKMIFFALPLLGHSVTVYLTLRGDLIGNASGAARLAFVAALSLVPVLLYRAIQRRYQQALTARPARREPTALPTTQIDPPPSQPARPAAVDRHSVQLLKSLGMILEDANPDAVPDKIVQTTIDLLQADVGVILRVQSANYADITHAYNRVLNRDLSGISLNLSDQPTLVNAIERQRQRGLFPDRNLDELDDLFTRLDIEEQRGPAYFQPLVHQDEVIAILLVAYPYAQRELRADEIELLKGLGILSSNLLAMSYEARESRVMAEERAIQAMVEGVAPSQLEENRAVAARQELESNLTVARDQIANLSKQVMTLKTRIDDERSRLMQMLDDREDNLSLSQRIRAVTDEQLTLQDERDRLKKRLQEAEAALNGATATDDNAVMYNRVQQLQEEKEMLAAERQRLQGQLDDLRAQDKSVAPEEMQRLLTRMVEEKERLQTERNQLSDRLSGLESELRELGIEDDSSGLSQWLHQLYDERVRLKEQNTMLQQERDVLLQEREKLAVSITEEKVRDERIQTLQNELENVASDREAALKQRDKLRQEREELQETLDRVKEHRARLLAQVGGFEIERNDAHEEQMQLRAEIQELADSRSELLTEHKQLQAELQAVMTERNQLLAQVDGDPARLQRVNEEGVGALRRMVNNLSNERKRLEQRIHELQRDLAAAEVRAEATASDLMVVTNGNVSYKPEQPELLMGLVQDLRNPMTPIRGFVDMLLMEKPGIINEVQRNFLYRVQANIKRLDTMIDALINVTALDTGTYELKPRPVDMVNVVEETITNASIQFRERKLSVSLDIDDSLPMLRGDEESLREIVGQLLTNAYLATPPEGNIAITVDQREMLLSDDDTSREACVFVAMRDSGGGIMPEDIPRVFARKYKAENPLIQGLGDTGVGMSIARALVEAHKGTMWVDSEPDEGTVFSFAIPLDLSLEMESD